MNVYVSFDGDGIGQKVGRASLENDVEGIRRIGQSIDHGNDIWRSWALDAGGSVIEIGGDEGRLEVPAEKLGDLPSIRSQYAQAVNATVTVGVGMSVREADQALLWGKLNGKDRISFFEQSMLEQLTQALAEAQARPESEKIAAEYLAKDEASGPKSQSAPAGHSAPGVFRNDVHSGMAYRKQPKGAKAPGDNPAPEKAHVPQEEHTHAASDYERHFRSLAHNQSAQDQAEAQARQSPPEDIRQQIVDVLENLKQAAPTLEAIKAQAPDVYEAVRDCVQAMIDMAKQMTGQDTIEKHESGKTCPKCHSGRVLGKGPKLFCPACKYSGPAEEFGEPIEKAGLPMPKNKPSVIPQPPVGTQDDGKLKIQHGDGHTSWVQVRAGMTLSQDGHPISSRKPNGK